MIYNYYRDISQEKIIRLQCENQKITGAGEYLKADLGMSKQADPLRSFVVALIVQVILIIGGNRK